MTDAEALKAAALIQVLACALFKAMNDANLPTDDLAMAAGMAIAPIAQWRGEDDVSAERFERGFQMGMTAMAAPLEAMQ